MPRLSFLFRTDIHLAAHSPISWKGDYTEEIFSNLEQIGDLANKNEVNAVLDAGDYFHIKAASKNPHYLIERSIRIHNKYRCPRLCVEGNHDIAYNNLESLARQPLGVLYASGVFQLLREQVFEDGDLRVRVVGVPYNPTRALSELLSIQKQKGDTHLIAIVHALAAKKPPASIEDFWNEPVFPYESLVSRNGPDIWCFPPGTPILDYLYCPIPIEQVVEGSSVQGRTPMNTVECIHPTRLVNEDLISFDIEGMPPSVLGVTQDHPYWVASGMRCLLSSRSTRRCHPDKISTSYPCSTCREPPKVSASWVRAGAVVVGDYLAVPVPLIPAEALSCPGLSRLLGYYVAEGHILENRTKDPVAGVSWSFHENEIDLHEDVRLLVKEYFGLETHTHKTTGSCIQVCAYGKEISDFFSEHGGRFSDKKRLSSWIWQRSAIDRLEFLVGWMLGDGHARRSKTEAMGATVSVTLAFQIYFLALSTGLRPYFTVRPPQKEGYYPCQIITFYGDDGEALSHRLGITPPNRSKTKVAGFFSDGLYYVRVRGVSRVPYKGPVHNFRTLGNTYLAGGILVHNCFGHWHKDQGVEEIGGKYFVNQGAVSRGALVRENLERTPQVTLIEFDGSVLSIKPIKLSVAPAEDVFDLEKKAIQEREHHDIDQFVTRLVSDLIIDPDSTIESNIESLGFADDVRKEALRYLELAEVG
jgi:hypothetical protein